MCPTASISSSPLQMLGKLKLLLLGLKKNPPELLSQAHQLRQLSLWAPELTAVPGQLVRLTP